MAEHVPGVWEDEVAAYDAGRMGSRRLMELEMSMIDVAPDGPPGDGRGAAARPGLRAVRPARAGGRRSRSRSSRTGSASSSSRRSRRSGWAELPVVTARTTFEGRRATIDVPERPPDAVSCAGRASATASSPTRPRVGPSCSSATARATATPPATATSCGPSARSSGSASRPAGPTSAGPSSARSRRGWRPWWTRGTRIRRRSTARAPTRSSAAPRSGARGCVDPPPPD